MVSFKWYHKCTGSPNLECEIRDGDPYYRVASDTLLVDVTSSDQGGRYYCTVHYPEKSQRQITPEISVAGQCTVLKLKYTASLYYTIVLHTGNSAPFLYTSTSLLPEHSVLTDVQQATGRNGQQWIKCRSGGQGTRPHIWMESEVVANSSSATSTTIGLSTQHPNGLYHCSSQQKPPQRKYFALFLGNSGKL